jgi:hypothetical protein
MQYRQCFLMMISVQRGIIHEVGASDASLAPGNMHTSQQTRRCNQKEGTCLAFFAVEGPATDSESAADRLAGSMLALLKVT